MQGRSSNAQIKLHVSIATVPFIDFPTPHQHAEVQIGPLCVRPEISNFQEIKAGHGRALTQHACIRPYIPSQPNKTNKKINPDHPHVLHMGKVSGTGAGHGDRPSPHRDSTAWTSNHLSRLLWGLFMLRGPW